MLEDHGFEPRIEDDGVALANCPFHVLAREHTELVCGMNLRLLEGVLDCVAGTRLVAAAAARAGALLRPARAGPRGLSGRAGRGH